MTKTIEALVEALEDACSVLMSVSMGPSRRVVRDGCVYYLQTKDWCKWAEDEVGPKARAALTQARAEQAEPVAERSAWFSLVMGAAASIEDAGNCLRDSDAKKAAEGAAKFYREQCKTLYTTPLAAPVAKLEPLTDAEIDAWWRSENGLEDCKMSSQLDFRMVVRAVEAAHNAKLVGAR